MCRNQSGPALFWRTTICATLTQWKCCRNRSHCLYRMTRCGCPLPRYYTHIYIIHFSVHGCLLLPLKEHVGYHINTHTMLHNFTQGHTIQFQWRWLMICTFATTGMTSAERSTILKLFMKFTQMWTSCLQNRCLPGSQDIDIYCVQWQKHTISFISTVWYFEGTSTLRCVINLILSFQRLKFLKHNILLHSYYALHTPSYTTSCLLYIHVQAILLTPHATFTLIGMKKYYNKMYDVPL